MMSFWIIFDKETEKVIFMTIKHLVLISFFSFWGKIWPEQVFDRFCEIHHTRFQVYTETIWTVTLFPAFQHFGILKLSSGTKCWNDNLSARVRKSICADYLWVLQRHVQFVVANPFWVYWRPLSLQPKDIMSYISWWCFSLCFLILSQLDWNQVKLQELAAKCQLSADSWRHMVLSK